LTNNFEQNEQKFNPILFKLIANDNTVQLENILKNKSYSFNINEQDKDGDTPLHISVFLSNLNAIKILIDYGADIYILDKWGQTSLHRICFSMGETKSVDILNIFIKQNNKYNKNNKVNKNIFNIQDNYGNTPCHLVLKHIIKNKTILNKNYKLLIKKIVEKTSNKLSNTDGYTVNDLLKNINL
jgi:ankyrin repeat protein